MKNAVFITATDTDAGKTWVTNHLIHALLEQRKNVKAIKPIACGLNSNGVNDDVNILLDTQGLSQASDINYCSFKKAAAPSIAALSEGKSIKPERLNTWCSKQASSVDLCLIESIGGLMVPITEHYLVSDWLLDMSNMPLILVVGAKLGCINHALLSLSYLSSINREPIWVIINSTDKKQCPYTIKQALLPYIPNHSNILACAYNQSSDLAPLISYLDQY